MKKEIYFFCFAERDGLKWFVFVAPSLNALRWLRVVGYDWFAQQTIPFNHLSLLIEFDLLKKQLIWLKKEIN